MLFYRLRHFLTSKGKETVRVCQQKQVEWCNGGTTGITIETLHFSNQIEILRLFFVLLRTEAMLLTLSLCCQQVEKLSMEMLLFYANIVCSLIEKLKSIGNNVFYYSDK